VSREKREKRERVRENFLTKERQCSQGIRVKPAVVK